MTDKLKPCPFCGGPAEYWGDDGKAGCASNMDSGCPFDEVMYAHEWNARPIEDALRAEVAALKAECAEAWRVHSEVVAELKAKLAKYTEPLTDEQADAVVQEFDLLGYHPRKAILFDAAIRRVRRGE